MTRATRKTRTVETSPISHDQLVTAVRGIHRVFATPRAEVPKVADLKEKTEQELKLFIVDSAAEFERKDFNPENENGFKPEEIEAFNLLNINTYQKKARTKGTKEKPFTRASALAETFKHLKAPATKSEVCKDSDKRYNERNPDNKGLNYEAAIVSGKQSVAEQFFRYAVPFAVESGWLVEEGTGENKTYFPATTQTEQETPSKGKKG